MLPFDDWASSRSRGTLRNINELNLLNPIVVDPDSCCITMNRAARNTVRGDGSRDVSSMLKQVFYPEQADVRSQDVWSDEIG